MKSSHIAGVIVFVLLLVGVGVYIISEDRSTTESDTTMSVDDSRFANTRPLSEQNDDETTAPEPTLLTLEAVSEHDNEDDCWTIINGSVYDITSYIPRHLGGDEILRACGEDGTSLFTQRTTVDGDEVGSGTPHSTSAARQLESLKIGEIQ